MLRFYILIKKTEAEYAMIDMQRQMTVD